MLWNLALPLAQTSITAGSGQAATEPTASAAFWIKLVVAVGIIVLSYLAARVLSARFRMPDHGWKIGLVAFAVLSGLAISAMGMIPDHDGKRGLKLGIDLQGGVVLVYQIKDDDFDTDLLITALRKRIDPTGTKQITVRAFGARQIEIIIPDVDQEEVDTIKRNVTDLGTLEFRILAHTRDHLSIWQQARKLPAEQREVGPPGAPSAKWWPLERDEIKTYYDPQKDPEGANRGRPGVPAENNPAEGLFTRVIRNGVVLQAPFPSVAEVLANNDRVEILAVQDPYNVTGEYLVSVMPGFQDSPTVDFTFDSRGSRQFGRLTGKYQPQSDGHKYRLGIILNGYLTGAPTLQSVITSRGQITGYQNNREGRSERDGVIAVLRAGQLPAQLVETPLSEFQMDATLGEDTVRRGLTSMAVSVGLVLVFMLFYYRFAGIIAALALTANLVLILALMISIKAALTLPGLAGLVLTIGMSVDANVLIFERIREEINRGAAMRMAIRNGFGKAMSTIVDANLTTLITAIVLYVIGTDQIRGFSVTLILGIGMSMFTAIFCSRLIFDIAEKRKWITSVKMMQMLSTTNIDFIGKRRVAFVVSMLVIFIGVGAVFARGRSLLDIDFTGGTSAQILFAENTTPEGQTITTAWVRRQLDDWDKAAANASRSELLKRLADPRMGDKLIGTLQLELIKQFTEEARENVVLTPEEISQRRETAKKGVELSPEDRKEVEQAEKQLQEIEQRKKTLEAKEPRAFVNDLTDQEYAQFREIAGLPDMTVTDVTVATGDATEAALPRFYINTSNRQIGAVEGILERVFGGMLATNAIATDENGRKMIVAAAGSADDETQPTKEKNVEEKKAKKDEGTKAKSPAEKKDPAKSEKAEPKTENKAKTPKTGAVVSPGGTFFTAYRSEVSRPTHLLAQADPNKKPAEADNDAKTADTKSKDDSTTETKLTVTFKDKISYARLQELLGDAAAAMKAGNPRFALRPAGEFAAGFDPDQTLGQTFKAWTVTFFNAPRAQAEEILLAADQRLEAQPSFPASVNIGKQVSNKMGQDGIAAILASLVGIVIYIWIRFQKVSFGLAAVVALVHDVLVTLGMLALSAYLTGIPFIDPFKISLNIVAAFLTIIGYSLNDTIVVFDRIREVKGKSPDLTADMVNRSINQTLSRTLLTSVTTLMVVVILFFFGGAGIHAFSFALVCGVLVGTYSSIFVAAPVLLWLATPSQRPSTSAVPARTRPQLAGAES